MKSLRILLLSGGMGKRLWPLSNSVRSKQFLKLLKREHGDYESMIQRVCRQLDNAGLLPSTYIITSESQLDMIYNQVDNHIPVICEPRQRGTFPSIALACAYLHSNDHISVNETICVLPVDSYVEPPFLNCCNLFRIFSRNRRLNLLLLVLCPSFRQSSLDISYQSRHRKRKWITLQSINL